MIVFGIHVKSVKNMSIKKAEVTILLLLAVSFLIGIYFYPQMPEKVATHWNIKGEVDGYQTKFWGVFLMPIFQSFLAIILIVLPRIDPLRQNLIAFRKHYDEFMVSSFIFIICIYIFIILWNLKLVTSSKAILTIISCGSSILFYYLGTLCQHAEKNWFIGVRTPWTLSSNIVWDKTNKLAGKLLKISGFVALFSIAFPSYTIFFVLVPISLVAMYTIAFSYFEYQRETNTFS